MCEYMFVRRLAICLVVFLSFLPFVSAQDNGNSYIEKRYNLFFRVNLGST